MSSNALFLIELLFTGFVVIGWASWELWSLRRDRIRSERAAASSPEDSGHAEGQHRAD